MADPVDGWDDEQGALEAAAARFFDRASSTVPSSKVRAAVIISSPEPITGSAEWKIAGDKLTTEVQKVELSTVSGAMKAAAKSIPGKAPRFSARIAELAHQHAGERAVALAQAIDDKTREALRDMIGRASRDYAKSQSLGRLRLLEREIRASIGLTPKQALRIERWRQAAEAAGVPAEALALGVSTRAEAAIAIRAHMIGERGVIESIGFARHQSWLEAVAAGDLPATVRKRWMNQGDSHVRPTHRAESRTGPIPLGQLYPIQKVMHPPSRDQGCRCWEVLDFSHVDDVLPPPLPVVPDPQAPPPAPVAPETIEEAPLLDPVEAARARVRTVVAEMGGLVDRQAAELAAVRAEIEAATARMVEVQNQAGVLDDVSAAALNADMERVVQLWKREGEVKTAARRGAHELLAVDEEVLDVGVEYKSRLDKHRKAGIQEGLSWLRSVLGRDISDAAGGRRSVSVFTTTKRRSFQVGRAVHMNRRADVGTFIHEMGHWLEQDPAILRRSVEFLERRTAGEPLRRLRDLVPRSGYRRDELARADKFRNPYTGKVYRLGYGYNPGQISATEILAMGLEAMWRDPLDFLATDPDFFEFVLFFLSGG